MPAVNKEVDSFENRMQKEAKDNLDKSAIRLPTQVHNFHDASSSSLEEEKQWEHMNNQAGSWQQQWYTHSTPKRQRSRSKGATERGIKI